MIWIYMILKNFWDNPEDSAITTTDNNIDLIITGEFNCLFISFFAIRLDKKIIEINLGGGSVGIFKLNFFIFESEIRPANSPTTDSVDKQ